MLLLCVGYNWINPKCKITKPLNYLGCSIHSNLLTDQNLSKSKLKDVGNISSAISGKYFCLAFSCIFCPWLPKVNEWLLRVKVHKSMVESKVETFLGKSLRSRPEKVQFFSGKTKAKKGEIWIYDLGTICEKQHITSPLLAYLFDIAIKLKSKFCPAILDTQSLISNSKHSNNAAVLCCTKFKNSKQWRNVRNKHCRSKWPSQQ